ncbi:sugar phosphate isomerase/epimerase family protein [Pseudonocardia acaciae]|uniref:sugar phosphate isomerase/epimerase family protein n=1 Tax=Pseudonocardia acaciae TaxID=551276 RepID=UPI0006884FB2|nr:sugar phosphate isomerase/epimerase family protein [Pseudonocardia acaciae]
MTLSCADYTWPAVPHRLALDIVAGLGFDAVDIGYMWGRSRLRPEEVGADVDLWAGRVSERCEARGLAVADVFYQAPDFVTMSVNHPDPAEVDRGRPYFTRALQLAARLGSPGVTILPGTVHDGDSPERALERSAAELRRRVRLAEDAGLQLSVEPHHGSVTDTPARTLDLLERVPGLRLTLDYGHFTVAGFPDEEIEPLVRHARHVQCRGAAPGVLQAGMRDNTIDFARQVAALRSSAYTGYLACEYVWAEWMGCDRVDNLSETVALRDVLRAATA